MFAIKSENIVKERPRTVNTTALVITEEPVYTMVIFYGPVPSYFRYYPNV